MAAKQQVKTMARLVETKRNNAEAAEAAYALAFNALTLADDAKESATKAWTLSLGKIGALDATTSADLEDQDRHVRSLRRVTDNAERAFIAAKMSEVTAKNAMTEARLELKRFEKWLEREAETRAIEVRRVERIAEDEVASRRRALSE